MERGFAYLPQSSLLEAQSYCVTRAFQKHPNDTDSKGSLKIWRGGSVCHLLLELEQAKTTGTNSFVLCISGLLNDLKASHYCLEFPVCMYAHPLE